MLRMGFAAANRKLTLAPFAHPRHNTKERDRVYGSSGPSNIFVAGFGWSHVRVNRHGKLVVLCGAVGGRDGAPGGFDQNETKV